MVGITEPKADRNERYSNLSLLKAGTTREVISGNFNIATPKIEFFPFFLHMPVDKVISFFDSWRGNLQTSPTTSERFLALDGLRGIFACAVAFFHFHSTGPIYRSNLVRHADLFVDFFFVLSGFVITLNYGHRLASLKEGRRFIILRLGRLYPLHIFVLILMVAITMARIITPSSNLSWKSFIETSNFPKSFLIEALLLQNVPGFGTVPTGWNVPSWSISVEIWAYFSFALLCLVFGIKRWQIFIVFSLPFINFLLVPYSFNEELGRCFAGFGFGCLCFKLYEHVIASGYALAISSAWLTQIEFLVSGIVIVFVVCFHGRTAYLIAPFVFALAIIVFSCERGAISRRILCSRPIAALGILSYGIYMNHWIVQYAMGLGAAVIQRKYGWEILIKQPDGSFVFGRSDTSGILAYLLMISITIAFSYITYRLIEEPSRKWVRRLVEVKTKDEQVHRIR